MKLDFNRDAFLRHFQIAAMVAPTRSPKAILQNVKLAASTNTLEIMANDTEVGVKLMVPGVEVKQPGEAVIPVSRLSMILRESNDDTMSISSQENKILITGKSSKFQLLGQNPEEFPDVESIEDGEFYEVASHVMKELIKRTLFATDTESSRYQLGGVLLEFEEGKLTAVGTDGRRLAKMEGPMKTVGKPEGAGTTIVPARSMQLIERMLPEGDEVVKIVPKGNKLLIGEPNGIFKTQLVEGRFPRWRDVIPNRNTSTKITLPVGPFYSALRQAAIVTNEESRGIDFTFDQGTVVLSNQTAEVGESRIEMPVTYDGAATTIALDNRYVADFLKVLAPDTMFTLDIQGSDQAAYCSTEDKYGYVIMPVQKGK
ncbi:MAG: DNA polymerase III subunit beta [Pirellulaceae bacterium]|jgi:DNA polymerase III subunit beta|nr:DNA polymerase III subunit beta [Pirellulaceae bacterium]